MYDTIVPIYFQGIFLQLEYFVEREKWGDPNKMDVRLLFALDRIRHELKRRIIVHCGYELSGHSENSLHKIGAAVDFHVYKTGKYELNALYQFFLEFWPGGVGVYPYWNSPGYHLDIGAPGRTWIVDQYGNYHYDKAMIKRVMFEYMYGDNE
jgi:uncharacterized protein YcbK (DUF882 family)